MKEINEGDLDFILDQIPDATPEAIKKEKAQETANNKNVAHNDEVLNEVNKNSVNDDSGNLIGQKLTNIPAMQSHALDIEADTQYAKEHKLTALGENINKTAEVREGWMDVDIRLLGERAKFYPEDWRFRIRPATVEAIRNWSAIDDENPNSIDDVFNEVLKSCLSIVTPAGPLPWGNIRSWDRFFFILLIREYTFITGERKLEYDEDCPNCDNPVVFSLTSVSLDYDLPDPEVMKHYNQETQTWYVDPIEYEVDGDPITFYLPTLEKDANIKAWLINRIQDKKKVDNIFIKFLPWLAPKISKDEKIASRQIRELEMMYKSWDADMFSLMDEVINNITVNPATRLITQCPICGEEVTSEIRFPNGIRSIFTLSNKRKKFGKK